MLHVRDLDAALGFFVGALGLRERARRDREGGRFTLVRAERWASMPNQGDWYAW
jgi:catechol 2,3-dioxygenase-like lactoylglutathione lyase family enzyme